MKRYTDRFGSVAVDYATFRPTYPAPLFGALAALSPRRRVAWDAATGNGQAACALVPHFDRIVASDASDAQLAAARRDGRVFYVRARSEAAPLASSSVDLVTVAQALHWLELPAFWQEVRRVLVNGGIIAAWCYSLCRIAPDIDRLVSRFYTQTVGPFWTPERALLDTGYRTVPFPFDELHLDPPDMATPLTLAAFLGYLGTWSATQAYRQARGDDPVVPLREALVPLWGGPDAVRPVSWPLYLRVGRV